MDAHDEAAVREMMPRDFMGTLCSVPSNRGIRNEVALVVVVGTSRVLIWSEMRFRLFDGRHLGTS